MVPYAELSEKAKEQDREWARKAAGIVGSYIETARMRDRM